MNKIINGYLLNGKPYSAVVRKGEKVGVVTPIKREDLYREEGPDLSVGPGAFCYIDSNGRRRVVESAYSSLYIVEDGGVYDRIEERIREVPE